MDRGVSISVPTPLPKAILDFDFSSIKNEYVHILWKGNVWIYNHKNGQCEDIGGFCDEKYLNQRGSFSHGLVLTWKGVENSLPRLIRQIFAFRSSPTESSKKIIARANVVAIVISGDGQKTVAGIHSQGSSEYRFPAGKVDIVDIKADSKKIHQIFENAALRELKEELNVELLCEKSLVCYDPSLGRTLSPQEKDPTSVTIPVYLVGKMISQPKPDRREFVEAKEIPLSGLHLTVSYSTKVFSFVAECLVSTNFNLDQTQKKVSQVYSLHGGVENIFVSSKES